jgi:Peptidase A4 family
VTYRSSRSSAEWIEESPTMGRRTLLPLDNFGTVTVSGATTVVDGKQQSVAQAGAKPVAMYGSGGRSQVLAQPSALGTDGTSFSVTRTSTPATGNAPRSG